MKVWEVSFHIPFLRSLNNNCLYPIMEECSLVIGLLPCSAAGNPIAQFPERPAGTSCLERLGGASWEGRGGGYVCVCVLGGGGVEGGRGGVEGGRGRGGATVTCLGSSPPGHCDAVEQLLDKQAYPQPPPAQCITTADKAVSGAVGVSRPAGRRAEVLS